jgi:hypothetical protein
VRDTPRGHRDGFGSLDAMTTRRPEPPSARWLRGAVFGALSVPLAAAAHVLGGASVPSVLSLLVLAVVVALVAAGTMRRPLGAGAGAAVVMAVQAVLHLVLMVSDAAPGWGASPAMAMPGMAAPALGSSTWSMLGAHLAQVVTTASGGAMLLGHAAAAALAGLWLASGDRIAVSLVALAVAPVAAALLRIRAVASSARVAPLETPSTWRSACGRRRAGRWQARSWLFVAPAARRGPPSDLLTLQLG